MNGVLPPCYQMHTDSSLASSWDVLARAVADEVMRWAMSVTGVGVMPPAEDALVGAGKGRSCLHATVRLNAIKRMLVAAAPASQHALGPSAQLHSRVRACACAGCRR